MKAQDNYLYDFESFRIDVAKRQLSHDEKVLPLTSKAFSTLMFLVENHGKIVTKEELINAVWADTAVEENNLAQQISTLRKVLGEQIRKPRFITTIPGEGYVFIAPVKKNIHNYSEIFEQGTEQLQNASDSFENQLVPDAAPKNERRRNLTASNFGELYQMIFIFLLSITSAVIVFVCLLFANSLNSKPTIGVAPFKALDNSEKTSIQSIGIPSYVTAKIGNLPNVIVRPIDSTGNYFGQEQNIAAIGRDNQVDSVLTGSTQSEGDNLRVIVQLWDIKNKRLVWAKTFTGNASESFSLQDTVAEEVVSALRN